MNWGSLGMQRRRGQTGGGHEQEGLQEGAWAILWTQAQKVSQDGVGSGRAWVEWSGCPSCLHSGPILSPILHVASGELSELQTWQSFCPA